MTSNLLVLKIIFHYHKNVAIHFGWGGFQFKKNFPTRKKKNFVCSTKLMGGGFEHPNHRPPLNTSLHYQYMLNSQAFGFISKTVLNFSNCLQKVKCQLLKVVCTNFLSKIPPFFYLSPFYKIPCRIHILCLLVFPTKFNIFSHRNFAFFCRIA